MRSNKYFGLLADLISSKDWSESALKDPEKWHPSLRMALSTIAYSKLPMLVFWGEEYHCFYNDAYLSQLGVKGKHPKVFGNPAQEIWPETWHFTIPTLDHVISNLEPTLIENQVQPVFINGKIENVYWNFHYSPIMDDLGASQGVLVTCHETTKEVQLNQTLRQSDEKYRTVIDNSLYCFLLTRPDGTILDANKATEEVFGYTLEEIRKIGRDGIIHHSSSELRKNLERRENEGRVTGELVGIKKGGERFPCEFSSVVFYDKSGEKRTSTVLIDISERKRIEKERALLINNTEESFVLLDMKLNIVKFNKQFKERYKLLLGKDIIEGDSIINYAQPGREEAVKAIYKKVLEGETVEFEIEVPSSSGKLTYNNTYKPAYDDNGQLFGAFVTSRDVTKTKLAQKELLLSEDKYRSIVEHTFTAVILISEEGIILNTNPAAETMFGYAAKDFLALPIQQFFEDQNLDCIKYNNKGELLGKRKNGECFYCEFSSAIFKDRDGQSITTLTLIDITERKTAEQKINKTNRLYAFISAINQTIVHVPDQETLFKEVCQIACEVGKFRMAWIGEVNKLNKSITPLEHFGEEDGYLSRIKINALKGDSDSLGPTGIAARTGRTDVCNHIDTDPRMEPWRAEALKRGYKSSIALPIRKTEGETKGIFTLYASEYNFFDSEEIALLEEVVLDIAFALENYEKAELHRQAEEQIIINERRYRALVENGADAIVILTPEGSPTYISPSIKRVLGYTEEEALGLDLFKLVHPDDKEGLAKVWNNILQTYGVPVPGYTSRMLHKDGSWRWLEATLTNFSQDPIIGGIVDNFRDVTDKILAEKEREFERKDKEALINATNDLIWSVDKDFTLIAGNRSFIETLYKSTGIRLKAGDNLLLRQYFSIDFIDFWQDLYTKALAGQLTRTEIYTPSNGVIPETWADISFTPIYEGEKVLSIACHAHDITKRKKREQEKQIIFEIINALQTKERVEESLTEVLAMIGKYLGFIAGEAWFVNKGLHQLTLRANWVQGERFEAFLSQEKIIFHEGEGLPGITCQSKEIVLWDNLANHPLFLRKQILSQATFTTGIGLPIIMNNEVIAVFTFFDEKPVINQEELLALSQGLSTQIAINIYSKQAEEALLLSNNRFRTIFQEAPVGIALLDPTSNLYDVNPMFANIVGRSANELTPHNWKDYSHPDDLEIDLSYMAKLENGELDSFSIEKRYLKPDNSIVWVNMTIATIKTHSKIAPLHLCMIEDITEQKNAKMALAVSEESYRCLFERNPDAVFSFNFEGKFISANQSLVAMLGSPLEVLYQTTFESFLAPEDKERVLALFQQAIKGETQNYDCEIITRNGQRLKLNITKLPIVVQGEIIGVYGIAKDITQQKRVEKAVKESEEKYKLLFDNSPLPKIIYDFETLQIFEVNQAAIQNYGYSKEEFVSMTTKDIRPSNMVDELVDVHKNINTEGVKSYGHWKHKRKDGSIFTVDVFGHKIIYNNRPAMIAAYNDITERLVAENAAINALEEKNTILESIGDAFFAVDQNWTVLYWNNMAEKVLQKPKKKILGKHLWSVFAESVGSESYKNYHLAIETNSPVHFQDYFEPLAKWYEISAYPAENGLSVYFKDITHRMLADIKLKQSHELLIKLTDKVPLAIYQFEMATNGEMSFPFMSKGAATVGIEKDPNEITSAPLTTFESVNQDDVERMMESIQVSYTQLSDWEMEYRTREIEGSFKWIRGSSRPEKRSDGTVVWYGYLQDITPLKLNEQMLRELNLELIKQANNLASSNQELERFAYVASHDLQEPLRMVSSFLQLLKKKYNDKLDDQAREYIHYAVDGSERMKQLILDLLEYSRAGTSEQPKELVNLNELLPNVLDILKQPIEESNAQINVDDLPTLKSVPSQMQQLFQNLIGNAIKYRRPNKAPQISVKAFEENRYWRFEIVDNGMGIDERFHEKIFVIFQRLHNRKEYKGTGIGLAICKKIVECHGGKISVMSDGKTGSTFVFTISK